ncbi:MAG: hypothetical protein Q7R34_03555 [Dehalococcoidia bacterium]|nr:hypothetical protein [Dehalococcoidia bacterium]
MNRFQYYATDAEMTICKNEGIDVYQTVRQAGFEIHVVREKSEPYTSFGLVLLE